MKTNDTEDREEALAEAVRLLLIAYNTFKRLRMVDEDHPTHHGLALNAAVTRLGTEMLSSPLGPLVHNYTNAGCKHSNVLANERFPDGSVDGFCTVCGESSFPISEPTDEREPSLSGCLNPKDTGPTPVFLEDVLRRVVTLERQVADLEQQQPAPRPDGCEACHIEAEYGTEECPHPMAASVHTCTPLKRTVRVGALYEDTKNPGVKFEVTKVEPDGVWGSWCPPDGPKTRPVFFYGFATDVRFKPLPAPPP